MYYKIVTNKSFFYDFCDDNDIDGLNIPYGTVLTAPHIPIYTPDVSEFMLNGNCFHFADGAFDTMLWHAVLIYKQVKRFQIYKIEPLSNVIKQRCNDGTGIYQCGAQKIRILEKQDIAPLYNMAIKEYYTDSMRYDNFTINLDSWIKHTPTAIYLSRAYAR